MRDSMVLDYIAIGERVIQRRRELGLTQEETARLVGVTTSFIGQIERAEKIASLATIARMSFALDTSLDTLVFGTAHRCEGEACPLYGDLEALLESYGLARREE